MSPISEIIIAIKATPPPRGMKSRIIAIDGPGGAGKTTLARQLAAGLNHAPIIHTDDFASWDNPLDWHPRLIKQVLKPLSQNRPARYQRYDWEAKSLAEWHDMGLNDYIILEGVSASRKAFLPYLTFSIWVETPREERLRRGLERDGEAARKQWEKWMAAEDAYIAREQPRQTASLVIKGSAS